MRGLMLIVLICSVLSIAMYSCNAETPVTTENPEESFKVMRYMSRRAAQEGGGGASGGAGAGMDFGFDANICGQAGEQASGQGGVPDGR